MRGRTWGSRSAVALLLLATTVLALVALLLPTGPAQAQQTSATANAAISDSSLGWGDTTNLHGTGWKPGQTIRVILYAGGQTLATPVAAADGSISATIRIPEVGSSTKYRLAVQGFGQDGLYGYVEVPLTITGPTPSISMSAKTLRWNEAVTVSGRRYKSGAPISISLFPNNTPLAKTTAGGDNTFDEVVRIPTDIPSSKKYEMVVTGQGIDLLFHFDVIEFTVIGDRPTMKVSTASSKRGQSITVTGRIFLKGTSATVTLLPGFEKLGTAPIQSDGTFSTSVKIPDRAAGSDPHQVVVTGQGLDGIFAYLVAPLKLGKTPPNAHKVPVDGTIDTSVTPPTLVGELGGTPASLPSSGKVPDAAPDGWFSWWVVLLIVLLALATVGLMVLTARRDVRENLRRRKDHLVRRLTQRGR